MTPDRIQEIRQRNAQARCITQEVLDISELLAALATAEDQLAECYRLSGADPDGNEDWRLAPYAVNAVKNLRANLDEADQEAEKLRAQLATAEAEGRRLAAVVHEYQQADAFHERQGYDDCECNHNVERQHCIDAVNARTAVLCFDVRQLLPQTPHP